jgi:hypothetical protein
VAYRPAKLLAAPRQNAPPRLLSICVFVHLAAPRRQTTLEPQHGIFQAQRHLLTLVRLILTDAVNLIGQSLNGSRQLLQLLTHLLDVCRIPLGLFLDNQEAFGVVVQLPQHAYAFASTRNCASMVRVSTPRFAVSSW